MAISSEHFRESEIRPQAFFGRWKKFLEEDLSFYFANKDKFIKIDCPGCRSKKSNPAFLKSGFEYRKCNVCDSLFVSPRPAAQALKKFYQQSRAMKFWGEVLKASRGARRRHQLFPLYVWFLDLIRDYQPKARIALDYKPKYSSLFLFEKNFPKRFEKIFLVEALGFIPNALSKNFKIINNLETFKNKVDIFTAFEVLDREFEPAHFIQKAAKTCKKGGLFLLTTNTISGFEYQILGRNSPRLLPPDRLNLLSVEAIEKLLVKNGFQILDLSTPGKLDVELVANALKQNPKLEMPDFLKYFFKCRDKDAWESFQDFLQLNRLSSYLRVAAIKK